MRLPVPRFANAAIPLLALACLAGARRPAHATELRVLSYNIQGLPFGVDHTRFRDIGRILKEARAAGTAPHVVLIQEAFSAATNEIPADWGYAHHQWGPGPFGFRAASGLLILSDYPIVERRYRVFRNCGGIDCMSRKGVLLARVAVPGLPRPVDFATTHLNSDYLDRYPGPAIGTIIRMRQVEEIDGFLERNRDPASAVVFGGDFNFRAGAQDFELFRRLTGLRNAAESPDWIDHLFFVVGSGVTAEVRSIARTFTEPVGGRRLSDHDAVEALLSLE